MLHSRGLFLINELINPSITWLQVEGWPLHGKRPKLVPPDVTHVVSFTRLFSRNVEKLEGTRLMRC